MECTAISRFKKIPRQKSPLHVLCDARRLLAMPCVSCRRRNSLLFNAVVGRGVHRPILEPETEEMASRSVIRALVVVLGTSFGIVHGHLGIMNSHIHLMVHVSASGYLSVDHIHSSDGFRLRFSTTEMRTAMDENEHLLTSSDLPYAVLPHARVQQSPAPGYYYIGADDRSPPPRIQTLPKRTSFVGVWGW